MLTGNAFNALLPQDYEDYLLHIETETGRKRTYKRFLNRIQSAASVLGAPASDGGLGMLSDDGELVGVLSHNSMDYSVLAYSLLSLAIPLAPISYECSREDLIKTFMTLSITRVFVHSDYLKTISSIFNQLLEKEAGWSPPKIYVLGGYNAYWWPEFWRMVQHARSTKMAPVAVRMARHDTPACVSLSNSKVITSTHGDLINMLPHSSPSASTSSSRIPIVLSTSPTTDIFRMFLVPRTYVILRKWSLHEAIAAIPRYRVTDLPVDERIATDLLRHPDLSRSALQGIMVVCGDTASARAVRELCREGTVLELNEERDVLVGGGDLWMMAPSKEMSWSMSKL